MSRPIFKKYPQHQAVLLPPSLDELIDKNHPVRVVDKVMDQINLDALLKKYKGAAPPAFIRACCSRWWCTVI
jgi:transposase